MRVALASDLHLEFGPISLHNTKQADVLILSGDILVAKKLLDHDDPMPTDNSIAFHKFMRECSERFPYVLYVMGNHEHYHGDFATTADRLKEKFSYLPNVHILDKEAIEIDGHIFFGGTLWTDMNDEDPVTMRVVSHRMNDFRCITDSNKVIYFRDQDGNSHSRKGLFTVDDSVNEHFEYLARLISHLRNEDNAGKPFIVIGHHAPSKLSVNEKYASDTMMNGAYSSSIDDFILDYPQIKIWTHGHTHDPFDYMLGSTRVICNPRGYDNYEAQADLFTLKFYDTNHEQQ